VPHGDVQVVHLQTLRQGRWRSAKKGNCLTASDIAIFLSLFRKNDGSMAMAAQNDREAEDRFKIHLVSAIELLVAKSRKKKPI
jgi:hypothetical protein